MYVRQATRPERADRCIFLLTCHAESDSGHPSDWRRIERVEDHGQGHLRVYVRLVTLTICGCSASADGLDGDLARLQQ